MVKDRRIEYKEAFGAYGMTREELEAQAALLVEEQLERFALRVTSVTEYYSWCDTREGMPDGCYSGNAVYSLEESPIVSGVILRHGAVVGVEIVAKQNKKMPLLFGQSVVIFHEYDDSDSKRHCAYTERASLIRKSI